MSRILRPSTNALGALFAAALLTVACSATSDAESDVDPNEPDGARALAAASCARMARCSADVLKQAYGDVGKCNEIEGAASAKDLAAPGAEPNPGQVSACIQTLGSGACGSSTAVCDLKGSEPVGAACGTSEQCASGYCKHGSDPSTHERNACGKCAATVGSGGDCTNAVCYSSKETCVNNRCTVLPSRGEACDSNTRPCLSPWACVNKTCVDRLPSGAACTTTSGSVPCMSGTSCINGACATPTVTYAKAGQTCNVDTASPTRTKCIAGECVKGKCVAYADLGQACDPNVGCLGSYICRGGTCVLDDASSCK